MVIDEANVLTEWQYSSIEQQQALKALLRFFIRTSKQENLGHVILPTSDYAFIKWLAGEIGHDFFRQEVIGDFPEEEAREFFKSQALLRAGCGEIVLIESDWAKVWDVCGGNAGQLLLAASAFVGDWDVGENLKIVKIHRHHWRQCGSHC